MSANGEQAPLEGASAPEFFESIGKKADQLNGTAGQDDEAEPKAVEQIESLCMNCHEQVRYCTRFCFV